jgi:putative two-component system response regulator
MPTEQCLEVMQKGRGTQFDPRVLDAFVARMDEIVRISVELSDD